MTTQTLESAFQPITGEAPPKGKLGRLAKKLAAPTVPFHEDPTKELKRLVQLHNHYTRNAVRMKASQADRERKKEGPNGEKIGSKIKCPMPDDLRADIRATAKRITDLNSDLERQMIQQLKTLPIYEHFFLKVFGCGAVASAYYCAMVKIEVSTKSSNLRRYCGYATDHTGRIERRSGGPKCTGGTGTYNDDLRRMGFLVFMAMRKNAAKFTMCEKHAETKPKKKNDPGYPAWRTETLACSACKATPTPYGHTTKYLTRAAEAKHGALAVGMPRYKADKKGFHKAIDLFLEDMYIVWRSLAGLPVWPSWYAMKLGFVHGGKVCVNEPKLLTLEQALETVGYLGKTRLNEYHGALEADAEEEIELEE